MVTAEAFVRELEEKNQAQAVRLLAAYDETLTREKLTPTDFLRLELKSIIESIEVAALWLADSDALEAKLSLAGACGDGERQYRAISDRLAELGLPPAAYDARFGGYSKLFAYCRSLQTQEERACASAVTLKQINVQRFALLASHCERAGDLDTARVFIEVLRNDEERHVHAGRAVLIQFATAEESQARARRSSFKTIELLGEVYEPSLVRKYLARSLVKK